MITKSNGANGQPADSHSNPAVRRLELADPATILGCIASPPFAARTGNAGSPEQNRYLRDNSTRRVADTDAAVASRL